MEINGELIIITSAKGGNGKSVTAANLAASLASLGEKVLLCDFSFGNGSLNHLLNIEGTVSYNIFDVAEGNCEISKAVYPIQEYSKLYYMPGSDTRSGTGLTEELLDKLFMSLLRIFENVIIDIPCDKSALFKYLLNKANQIYMVSEADSLSLKPLLRFISEVSPEIKEKMSLIMNKVRLEVVREKGSLNLEQFVNATGITLLGVVLDDSQIYSDSSRGEIVDRGKSGAGKAYSNIALRIQGEDIPIKLKGK